MLGDKQTVPNPNPTYKIQQKYSEPLAKINLSVKVGLKLDEYVRSLPNRAEWLRQAIAEKYERDKKQNIG